MLSNMMHGVLGTNSCFMQGAGPNPTSSAPECTALKKVI